MPMEIDRKELKRRARESMRLTNPKFWVVALVYFLMTTGLSYAVGEVLPLLGDGDSLFSASLFLSILMTLYAAVVQFGFRLWSLWTCRRLDPGLGSLVQGFSVAGRVLLLELGIYGRTVLWSLCLSFCLLVPILLLTSFATVFIVPATLLVYAGVWAVMLRYSMAPYLLADRPDDGSTAAIHRSTVLMHGWKWELFKLEFSFLGWYVLQFLLSLLVLAAFLVASGFLQDLFALGLTAVPDLLAGYELWMNGISPEVLELPQAYLDLIYQFDGIYAGTWTSLVTELVVLPVFLWLTPYLAVTEAEFYEARLRLQLENAPQL